LCCVVLCCVVLCCVVLCCVVLFCFVLFCLSVSSSTQRHKEMKKEMMNLVLVLLVNAFRVSDDPGDNIRAQDEEHCLDGPEVLLLGGTSSTRPLIEMIKQHISVSFLSPMTDT
jgi:hypothetical protein